MSIRKGKKSKIHVTFTIEEFGPVKNDEGAMIYVKWSIGKDSRNSHSLDSAKKPVLNGVVHWNQTFDFLGEFPLILRCSIRKELKKDKFDRLGVVLLEINNPVASLTENYKLENGVQSLKITVHCDDLDSSTPPPAAATQAVTAKPTQLAPPTETRDRAVSNASDGEDDKGATSPSGSSVSSSVPAPAPAVQPANEELDGMFATFLDELGLSADKRAAMMAMPAARKWMILSQQQAYSDLKKSKTQEGKNEDDPQYMAKVLKVEPTLAKLENLRAALASQPLSWLQAFVQANGVQVLTDILSQLAYSKKEKDQKMEGAILLCMKSLMNTKFGMSGVMKTSNSIRNIALCLDNKFIDQKLLVAELLLGVAHTKPDGHGLVIEAMKYYQKVKGEKNRFQTLVESVKKDGDDQYKITLMTLINALCNLPEEITVRVGLREDLEKVGIWDVIQKLQNLNPDLDAQLNAYLDEAKADEDELAEAAEDAEDGGVDKSLDDPVEIIKVVRGKLTGADMIAIFIDVLQNFMIIPSDNKDLGKKIWTAIDDLVGKVVYMTEKEEMTELLKIGMSVKEHTSLMNSQKLNYTSEIEMLKDRLAMAKQKEEKLTAQLASGGGGGGGGGGIGSFSDEYTVGLKKTIVYLAEQRQALRLCVDQVKDNIPLGAGEKRVDMDAADNAKFARSLVLDLVEDVVNGKTAVSALTSPADFVHKISCQLAQGVDRSHEASIQKVLAEAVGGFKIEKSAASSRPYDSGPPAPVGGGPPPPPPPPGDGGGGPPPPPPPPGDGPPPPPPPPGGGPPPPPPPPGGGPPPPPGAPPPPGGAPPPPGAAGGLPPKRTIKHETPLKQIFWTKIQPAKISSTVWKNANDDKIIDQIDPKEMAELFSSKPPQKKKEEGAEKPADESTPQKKKKVQVLDTQRSNNVGVMLRSFTGSFAEVREAILQLDDEKISENTLNQLVLNAPKSEEIEALKEYEKTPDVLGESEQFFLEMMKIKGLTERLSAWQMKRKLGPAVVDIEVKVDALLKTCEDMWNTKFKRVLEVILAFGNFLNGGSARGAAYGFKLDAIIKMVDTKANGSKITLLHYIATFIDSKFPDLSDWPELFTALEDASRVQYSALTAEIAALSQGVDRIRKTLETLKDGEGDTFRATMTAFLENAEFTVKKLQKRNTEFKDKLKEVADYFGEDPTTIISDEFFGLINKFVRDYTQCVQENAKAKALKMQEENRQKVKAAPPKIKAVDTGGEDNKNHLANILATAKAGATTPRARRATSKGAADKLVGPAKAAPSVGAQQNDALRLLSGLRTGAAGPS